uniref:RNA-directed DNA polymerase, eukaryota n=1 Tax=Tanacetum cinerariifolium TaxID=118510 RepID=A0A699HCA3_TANCI|nr:RNA-directed DNA polymerase, eukaryota [Tanacetum cinerariifolium]
MPKKAGGVKKDTWVNEVGNSYVHVVKGQMQPENKESEATPALVLSDECLLSKDLSKYLFGRVKQFASLANIRKAVSNEGFADIKIQYMGELWVLLEFVSEDSMKLFQDNVEVEGIPFKLWSDNTFKRIATQAFWIHAKEAPGWVPDFMKENDDEEQNDDGGFNVHELGSCGGDSDVEGVLETIFEESGQKENNLDEKHTNKQKNHSGDPVSIYKLLKKNKDNVEKENNTEHSMKYPPGFTPKEGTDVVGMHAEESRSDNIVNLSDHNAEEVNNTFSGNFPKKNSKEDVSNSVCSSHFKTSMVPRTGGSILSLMDELVKVGDSVGNSGGILCVWDPNSFRKSNATVSDYFIMIRGVRRQTGNDLLIITVYAPHDLKDKHMLWDYLTYEIGKWKREVNMLSAKNVKAKYKDELEALEVIIDKGDGNVEVVNKRMEVVNTLQKIDKICSSEMAQKAKVKWSIKGDENTSFFHGMLNKKWSLLNIRGIMVDGMWIESPNRVKGESFHRFSSRFDKPDARRAHIEMRYPKTLTCDQQVKLESDVSNEEIKRAIWDCGIDKSPGPDGFTFGFYRRFWNLIENDVYDAVKYFITYGVIPKGFNSYFIALILKIPDANTVKDFRPISLIGSLYKIITKILANRLVGVLGDIVNEIKKQTLIFNVDFEKAYDSVRWDFLDDILKNFGFGEKWCMWIQSCLRSSRRSILINGSPTKEFQFFKGLKQGDPLSSFLFILIMESLHLSFQRVVDARIFKGIKLRSSLSISHMLYADDAVFACQWCDGNITTLVHVLECFYRASGLRINMSKSKIMGVLVDSDKVKCDASKLKCLILKTPFSYLDLKVGGSMSRVHTWNEMWRFYTQNTSLWVRVIKAILGDDEKVGGYVKDGAKSCWLSIVNEIYSLKNKVINSLDFMHVKLGNGDKTAFWEDIWIEGKALKNRYPRIYSLETCKLIIVGMKLAQTSLNSSFRRVPSGGVEQEQFDELLALVHDVTLTPMSDRWIWASESSGDFFVASVRKVIDDKSLPKVDSKTRWIKCVPIKVNVHAWKVKTDSLPTRFNVSRRGIHIDSIMCAICDKGAETSSHLFFSCCMARQTVRMITRWWDVPYCEVGSYEDRINWFVNLRLSYKHKQMFEGFVF